MSQDISTVKSTVWLTTTEVANSTETSYNYELEWLLVSILTGPLAAVALYVAITQIMYCAVKEWRSRGTKGKARQSSSSSTSGGGRRKNVSTEYAFVLNIMVAVAATGAFLRAGIDFRWFYGRFNDFACDLSIKFKLANYILSLVTVYMVLWLRQRIFYNHPRLKHLSSRLIRTVSWGMSVVIILGVASTSVLFFAVGKYLGSPLGCVVQKNAFTSLRWYILILTTTFFQVCLLTLFIYPLIKHHRGMKSAAGCSGKQNPVIPLVKRAAITATVCVVTDITFALIILVLKNEVVTLSTYLYDVNVVLNVMSMLFSFPDWSTRLRPWRVTDAENEKEDRGSETNSRLRTSESGHQTGVTSV